MKLACLLIASTSLLRAAPEIRSIVNAASYAPGIIAQGSLFVIFGDGLGPESLEQAQGSALPVRLGGTSVRITSGSVTFDAPLLYAWKGQVAAVLPPATPIGIAFIAVTYDGRAGQAGAIRVVRTSPGILTQNQRGSGSALAQNFNSASDQPRNSLGRPARPGQTMVLWATGLGSAAAGSDLEVLVGGRPASVRNKGPASCCAGADQINFEVPQGVEGCYVPVVLRSGTATSNFATISVAPQGAECSDVIGLTGSQIERIESGGRMRLGFISLSVYHSGGEWGDPQGYSEFAWAQFSASEGAVTGGRLGLGRPSYGSCTTIDYSEPGGYYEDQPPPLDAGAALSLTGPKGTRSLPRRPPGFYEDTISVAASEPQFFVPGSYTVDNGSGGADVGAFRISATLQSPVTATQTRVPLGILVAWRGGDPGGALEINGYSQERPAGFRCTARASDGQFTIPAYVLAGFSENTQIVTAMIPGSSPQSRFRAPGLDAAFINFFQY